MIAAVRQGDIAAFGILYERHLTSAKRAASYLARTPAEREDLVAEAFTRVLRILREGRGPVEEFRPYLLVTLRNTAIHSATRGLPVALYADLPDSIVVAEDGGDPVIDRWNAGLAATAFASLPERWRVVLWHTEVEKESPAQIATLLGMRPNSVAALAYRAREGLRQAYLRMHDGSTPRPQCAQTVKKLAGFVRGNLPSPLSDKIGRHLAECRDCRARAEVLTSINSEIAGLIAPLVLGAPLAAAYLQATPAVVTAAIAAAESGLTGLTTGVLAMKATVLKAGAAALVAVTALTTTAAGPALVPAREPTRIRVVDGERTATLTVPTPPTPTVLPPLPTIGIDAETAKKTGNGTPNRGPDANASENRNTNGNGPETISRPWPKDSPPETGKGKSPTTKPGKGHGRGKKPQHSTRDHPPTGGQAGRGS
ncbi:hypothetical protein BLA60_32885 [Actinophytocola xinjiangensis]|uniref:RNA polymerase sigma factor (Sigma-70 family) n=1 Tax=Actinophytocola xinjiangensis TaxID=485602 RepID=A0A7Z1AV95_9PSEU|nr:sigma-70 family RNA polymerase sigma factor [Actinophytocola xinjiangensis]OLF06138.1 hypothetical protein BLA60_32885 [Actinophytocola xinjiangensis]